jgi:hypothetical protein
MGGVEACDERSISTYFVTSARPWFCWVNPSGVEGARIQVCADRACARVEHQWDAPGSRLRAPTRIATGVHFWRAQNLRGGAVEGAPTGSWEFVVPTDVTRGTQVLADLNGDGFEDRVESVSNDPHWLIRVYFGHAGGATSTAPDQEFESVAASQHIPDVEFDHVCSQSLGAIRAIGDINHDGYGDVAVEYTSIFARDHGGSTLSHNDEGIAYFGGPSGLVPGTPEPRACVGGVAGTRWLNGVFRSPAGDLNGDGNGDWIVSRRAWPAGSIDHYMVLGGRPAPPDFSTELDGNALFEKISPLVGDFDADGRSEVVIRSGWDVQRSVTILGGSASSWAPGSYFNHCGARVFSYTPELLSVNDSNDDGYDELNLVFASYPAAVGFATFTGSYVGLSPDRCTVAR